ncbi:MAG: MFS transporter [Bordetella sp.]|nr:MFS transporter [Bordetella sp.]
MAYGLTTNSIRMMVGATSSIYLMSKGLSIGDLAIIKSTQALVILVADVPFGYFADRYSRKAAVLLSTVFTIIWLAMTAAGDAFLTFLIAEVFNALSMALFSGAFTSLLLATHEKEQNNKNYENVIGVFYRWQFLLMGIAAFAGSSLFSATHSTVWWWAAGLIVVAMLGLGGLLSDDRIDAGAPVTGVHRFSGLGAALKRVLFSSGSALLFWSTATTALLFQVIIQFWQPILFGGEAFDRSGYVYGFVFLCILLAQSAAAHVATKLAASRTQMVMISLGMPLCFFLIPHSAGPFRLALSTGFLCLAFFFIKLAHIHLYASFQRTQSEALFATAESLNSSVTRLLLLVWLPFIGRAGDIAGAARIPTLLGFLALVPVLLSALHCMHDRCRARHES